MASVAENDRHITPQFRKLVAYMAFFSADCAVDVSAEEFQDRIAQQWKLMAVSYAYTKTKCPCETPITVQCHLRNANNGNEVFVGSECVKRFDDEHKAILEVEHTLHTGFVAYLEQDCCSHGSATGLGHLHFRLVNRAKINLVTKNHHILNHFGGSPLYIAGSYPYIVVEKRDEMPALIQNDKYDIVCQLTSHPTEKRAMYTFVALKKDVEAVADAEEFVVDEQNEPSSASDDSIQPDSSESSGVGEDDDEDEDDESNSSSVEVVKPRVTRPRGKRARFGK